MTDTAASLVRTDDLDADMVEVVAALANAYHQHVNTERPALDAREIADADWAATRVQRYLDVFYPGERLDRLAEWTWTLDQARDAGLT